MKAYIISTALVLAAALAIGANVLLDAGGTFDTGATTVAVSGYTTIGDPIQWDNNDPTANGLIVFEVANAAGSGTLDGFKIQMQDHPDGQWYDYLSGSDFDTATTAMLFATTTGPHEVAAEGYAHAHVKARGYAIRFQASSASSTASVRIRGKVGRP